RRSRWTSSSAARLAARAGRRPIPRRRPGHTGVTAAPDVHWRASRATSRRSIASGAPQKMSALPQAGPDDWKLDDIVADLRSARMQWRSQRGRVRQSGDRQFPSVEQVRQVVLDLCGALFPMRLGPADLREENEDAYVQLTLAQALDQLRRQVRLELGYLAQSRGGSAQDVDQQAAAIVRSFASELPAVRRMLD